MTKFDDGNTLMTYRDLARESVTDDLFGMDWSRTFCRCWNTYGPEIAEFSSIGAVRFEVLWATRAVSTTLFWDENGQVAPLTQSTDRVPSFSGGSPAWEQLLSGRSSAVALVLRKALIYRGPVAFAISHGQKFDRVAEVGRRVTLIGAQRRGQ